jgi:hypothetical protein
MQNPAESFWLAQAKLDLLQRDPVDAANDADALARFAQGRLDALLRDAGASLPVSPQSYD